MNPVTETTALLAKADFWPNARTTKPCHAPEALIESFFQANPTGTAAECAKLLLDARRFPAVAALFDFLKQIKALAPVLQELYRQLQTLCPDQFPKPAARRPQTMLQFMADPDNAGAISFLVRAGFIETLTAFCCPAEPDPAPTPAPAPTPPTV